MLYVAVLIVLFSRFLLLDAAGQDQSGPASGSGYLLEDDTSFYLMEDGNFYLLE